MQMKLTGYIKGVIAIAALAILCGCNKPKDLKYGMISNIAVKNISLSGVDVEGNLPVENPNGFPVNITGADLDILANDKIIAHVTQLYPITLPSKSKGDYKVGANISLANQGEMFAIMGLLNGKTNIDLDGTVRVRAVVFQKNVHIHETGIEKYLKPVVDKIKLF
jgi:LEA14-like dessication related protein